MISLAFQFPHMESTHAFNAALGSSKYGPYQTEVFRRIERPGPHVFETPSQLFPHGQIGKLLARSTQRGIVAHLRVQTKGLAT